MMPDVNLTENESRMCTWVGKMRHANAVEYARECGRGASATTTNGPELHILGAHAEYAASIALNLYWRPNVGLLKEKDVGGLVQVRSTRSSHYALTIKPKDHDADPFVLALQLSLQKYRMRGWLFAGDVKARFPLRADRGDPAHHAEAADLADMEGLLRWIEEKRNEALRGN
jgi:hypothetical protein